MVQIKGNTAMSAKKERRHYNSPRNFYEAQMFAPPMFVPQTTAPRMPAPGMPVPRMPVPRMPVPRMPVPQTFMPRYPAFQMFAPQTFTPHLFAIRMSAPREIVPQSIMLQPIVPQAIAPGTIMPRTFAPQTSQVALPASSTSTCSTRITPQRSHAIQQNQLQSGKLAYMQTSRSTNISKSLTSIWTYVPELSPVGTILPVTISTPWYGANWEITDPCDMSETYAKISRRARGPFSHVRANTVRKSKTIARKLFAESSGSLESLWKVPIAKLYEAYAPHKPQHQSETSETLLREQQKLISQDFSNLNINELIPTF